jgi:hypothetical protein
MTRKSYLFEEINLFKQISMSLLNFMSVRGLKPEPPDPCYIGTESEKVNFHYFRSSFPN